MNDAATVDWAEANQRHLLAALAGVRRALARHAARSTDGPAPADDADDPGISPEAAAAMSAPPALARLCTTFRLSPFERDVMLLCAGVELDATFPALCASSHGDSTRAYPTFSLALAALPGAHWSALTPDAPLRHWRLVEVASGGSLTTSALRIEERVLHFLAGVEHLDERLAGLVERLGPTDDPVPSQRTLVERLVTVWSRTLATADVPVVQLCGDETAGKRAVAAAACRALGLQLGVMSGHVVPAVPVEMETLIRLWEREAALSATALMLDCDHLDPADVARAVGITRLISRLRAPLIFTGRDRRSIPDRSVVTFDVQKPSVSEQLGLWRAALGPGAAGLNGRLDAIVAQFRLSTPSIRAACAEAVGRLGTGGGAAHAGPAAAGPPQPDLLWDACRTQVRSRLDDLAQRIEPAATWDDLVLSDAQRQILGEMAVHVRQRTTVYEHWGFAAKGARGLGISALFAGPSGTGKTMAAEVLANDLRLDLYRIDLSQVVSKYIGETEKNLRRVFDAAEDGGAILLFDEADALFGKRGEVKDSHDRYANIEVSYLLQRIETYRGLAILTTNMKSALDQAFLRRLRFIIHFPFPDFTDRAAIWRRIFPTRTPTEGLEPERLARLDLAGGNIRNVALHAAFLAAEAGQPVAMAHVVRAARAEYAKLEKPFAEPR
jgi:hypothetical protein